MNFSKEIELQKEIESKFNKYVKFDEIRNIWDMAIYYNRLQNSFISDNEENETVKSLQAFNPRTEKVETFNIKARSKYNRKQWFYILLTCDSFYYNIEQIRNSVKI